MWMQWSITRLVRWRVRDWASCFTACSNPPDDEENEAHRSSSPPKLPIRNMVFETRNTGSKGKKTNKNLLRRNGCKKKTTVSAENTSNKNDEDSGCWTHFGDDEDYIVFCFREDGAFDVVKDGKSEASNHIDCRRRRRSSWPVNRKKKKNFGESAKAEIIPVEEEEEEEIVYLDIESAASSNGIRFQTTEGMVESSDSNRSDNSTASFAFPVLGWERMGSPAQMPKSQGLHMRKHKACSLSFQCCRF